MPFEIILIVLVLLVFVGLPLVQIRKQNKRIQQIRQFQDQLGPGMVVKTTSGLHGRVVHVGDTTVDLEIATGVVTTWELSLIHISEPTRLRQLSRMPSSA